MEGRRMTADQLVEELARRTKVEPAAVKQLLGEFAKIAMRETKKSGEFIIPGIGSLVKSVLKPRMGRNPITGEPVKVSARTTIRLRFFKAAEEVIMAGKEPSAGWAWCYLHGHYRPPPPCPLGSHPASLSLPDTTPEMEPLG